jgi:phenylacetate-CoA ligase
MSPLRTILALGQKHPWYRDQSSGSRLDDWPILTKSDLYARLARASDDPQQRLGVYYSRSGGTQSDRPLFFPVDIPENHAQREILARFLRADSVLTPQSVVLNLCPIVRMYRAMEIFNEYCERCGSTVLPMAALAEDDELLEVSRYFRAGTLIGMPTRILAFARYLRERQLSHPFETVIFGGEFLQPSKQQLIAETLQTRRFCGLYGSAELGVVAWSSDLGPLPRYRFPREVLQLEIIDPGPQGFGKIVATSLIRRRFPIIRYETGDLGKIVGEDAATVTVELGGREGDSFQIGDNYHRLADFARVLDRFSEFQVQIRYEPALKQDVIRFCLVEGKTPADKASVETEIRGLLQAHEKMYRVEVAFVPSSDLIRKGAARKTPALVDTRGL